MFTEFVLIISGLTFCLSLLFICQDIYIRDIIGGIGMRYIVLPFWYCICCCNRLFVHDVIFYCYIYHMDLGIVTLMQIIRIVLNCMACILRLLLPCMIDYLYK